MYEFSDAVCETGDVVHEFVVDSGFSRTDLVLLVVGEREEFVPVVVELCAFG